MTDNGYGLWFLVVFNSALFIVFAVSFFHPKTTRDWRALGGFSAFVLALFTEMYGYPLTVYLLTGPFAGLIPGVNFSHNAGSTRASACAPRHAHICNICLAHPVEPCGFKRLFVCLNFV